MRKFRLKEPRVAVFCRCGLQWLGRSTVDNPLIDAHLARHGPMITAVAYERLGYRIRWPQWWTEDERRRVRSARKRSATVGLSR